MMERWNEVVFSLCVLGLLFYFVCFLINILILFLLFLFEFFIGRGLYKGLKGGYAGTGK